MGVGEILHQKESGDGTIFTSAGEERRQKWLQSRCCHQSAEKMLSFKPSCGSPALLLPLYFHYIDEFAAEISANFHEFSLIELK